LQRAARSMRCSVDCDPANCLSRVHDRFGSRSHVVSASRRTKHRTGWSFSGLTRTVQRRLRREWFESRAAPVEEDAATDLESAGWALEQLAERGRRELRARAAAFP